MLVIRDLFRAYLKIAVLVVDIDQTYIQSNWYNKTTRESIYKLSRITGLDNTSMVEPITTSSPNVIKNVTYISSKVTKSSN